MHLVTRFAPSPTGYLHLGHIASLLYVFAYARHHHAKVLLRIEDHDRERSRKEYEQAILDDIAWLGLIPDNWQQVNSVDRPHEYRQSNRNERYWEVLNELQRQGRIYYCSCSRREILEKQEKHHLELYYDGHCRQRGLENNGDVGTRVLFDDDEYAFTDQLLGALRQKPAEQCGDMLLRDRRQNWTYNYAVVIDDIDQGVNLIIRGEDILDCTGRQIALAQMIDPAYQCNFLHHPLICDEEGKKLSKRLFSEAVAKRREQGETPEHLIGDVLYYLGMIPDRETLPLDNALAQIIECQNSGRQNHQDPGQCNPHH
ncbi:MAG: hypothetical protein H7A37_09835 [Chlamydiales bacterium]|nr:hypothetical protein [Chlamydiia bacterium]MCP5508576.1 hypothetical protein [Chlamydiales bacterium]